MRHFRFVEWPHNGSQRGRHSSALSAALQPTGQRQRSGVMQRYRALSTSVFLGWALAQPAIACVASADVNLAFASKSAVVTERDEERLSEALERVTNEVSGDQWSVHWAVYVPMSESASLPEREDLMHKREEGIRLWFVRRGVRPDRLEQPRYSSPSAPDKIGSPGGYAEVLIHYACRGS